MQNKINLIFSDLKSKLESNNNFVIQEPIEIDNLFFNLAYSDNDIRKSLDHSELFQQLNLIKKPVLYWFAIKDKPNNVINIRNKYLKFKKTEMIRNCASFKAKFDNSSRTLYVGKVKTGFWGRLITHLGYSKSPKTAGLQLFHWYDCESFSNLTLNYIVFEKEMENLISIFEIELANQLKPILGRY